MTLSISDIFLTSPVCRYVFLEKRKKSTSQCYHLPLNISPFRSKNLRVSDPFRDDDVELVKQLTALGFSRTQAVDALGRYGYDVQRASSNLLGAPDKFKL